MWREAITPSQHEAARQFVTLDNFYCAGEVSANGWPWSTGAREADYGVMTVPLNYANRGFSDDSDGLDRDVNISYNTPERVGVYPTVNGIGNIYQVLGNAMPGGYTNLLAGEFDDFCHRWARGIADPGWQYMGFRAARRAERAQLWREGRSNPVQHTGHRGRCSAH